MFSLLYPLPLGILGALFFGALLFYGFRRIGFAGLLAVVVWLWVWSTPAFADWLRYSLESRYANLPAEAAPSADAIVVLGGGFLRGSGDWPYPSLNANADRYWHGARLFNEGKGEYVILTGGRIPVYPESLSEAEAGAVFLGDLGIPDEAMLLDTEARTTRENAVNVAGMLEENELESFLLVTSALHMRRSEAVFRGAGLDPIPVATDFRAVSEPAYRSGDFLPRASALDNSSSAFHEYAGFWMYRLRGWM